MRAKKTYKKRGLLDLPAEIWSKIGKYAIEAGPSCLPMLCGKGILDPRKSAENRKWHQPPITRTCRVLREELLPRFHATKIQLSLFPNADTTESRQALGDWLNAIGDSNRKLVRGIYLTISEKDREKFKRVVQGKDWLVPIEFGESISLFGLPTWQMIFL